ncbi:four helix bundle protein [Planctomycetota bacterium]
MNKKEKSKPFDLDERTFKFAKDIRGFVKKLTKTISNKEDIKQLIRASGSVGANYIEANEALSKKDFYMRIKICRKEAKESNYWLRLIDVTDDDSLEKQRLDYVQESKELTHIFGAIISKSK